LSEGLIISIQQIHERGTGRLRNRFLSFDTAFCAELPGQAHTSASDGEAMVLAVYMPPQEPRRQE